MTRNPNYLATFVCLSLFALAEAANSRDLLTICAPATPNSIDVPQNALLYVSGDATGTSTYQCGPNGKPNGEPISVDGTFNNPQGWDGHIFINKDGYLQFDLGQLQNDTHAFVNSTVVTDKAGFVSQPDSSNPNNQPYARWNVLSTDAQGPPRGLPGIAYVTRIDTTGGLPAKCPAGGTASAPFQAVYNLYTCDPAYLPQAPPPLSTTIPILGAAPVSSLILAPSTATAPTLTTTTTLTPASAPTPSIAPVPSLVSVVAPAPLLVRAPPPLLNNTLHANATSSAHVYATIPALTVVSVVVLATTLFRF